MQLKLYLIFILFIPYISCTSDNNESEITEVKIEKEYDYIEKEAPLVDIPKDIKDLFRSNISLVNSEKELKSHPLFTHIPPNIQKELLSCDFTKRSLVLAATSSLYKADKIKLGLVYNKKVSQYHCTLMIQSKSKQGEEKKNVYFVLSPFEIENKSSGSKIDISQVLILDDPNAWN